MGLLSPRADEVIVCFAPYSKSIVQTYIPTRRKGASVSPKRVKSEYFKIFVLFSKCNFHNSRIYFYLKCPLSFYFSNTSHTHTYLKRSLFSAWRKWRRLRNERGGEAVRTDCLQRGRREGGERRRQQAGSRVRAQLRKKNILFVKEFELF